MKKAFLHITPIVGLPQANGWAQVADNSHSLEQRLICAFAVEGENAGNIGRTITDAIAAFKASDTQSAVEFIEEQIEYCSEQGAVFSGSALFVQSSQSAFIAVRGAAVLKRDQKVGQILVAQDELRVLVGKHTSEDIVVLSTGQAVGFLPEVEQKFKIGFDTDTIITSIVPGVHNQENSATTAMAFVVRGIEEIEPDPVMRSVVFDQPNTSDIDKVLSEQQSGEFLDTQAPDKEETATKLAGESNPDLLPTQAADDQDDQAENDQAEISKPAIDSDKLRATSTELLSNLEINKALSVQNSAKEKPLVLLFKKLLKLVFQIAKILIVNLRSIISWLVEMVKKLIQKRDVIKPGLAGIGNTSTAVRSTSTAILTSTSRPKLIAGFIVVALIAALGIFAVVRYQRSQAEQLQAVMSDLEPIANQVAQAEMTVVQSPIESREQVSSAIAQLEAMLAQAESSGKSRSVQDAIKQALENAKSTQSAISGQIALNNLAVFYDLRLVSSDFVSSFAHSQGSLAVFYDQQKQQLVALNLETKQVKAHDFNLPVRAIKVQGNRAIILADGVYSFELSFDNQEESPSEPEKIIDEGDSNREANLLGSYETYIYVFNAQRRNIYRYAQVEDGYSDPIGWMQAARGLEYSTVSDMAIDGDLWLSTNTGEIFKFASGRAQDFAVVGLNDALSSTLLIATDVNQEKLYVLESEKNRVVVLGKDGSFIQEVVSSSLAAANDIFVSESLGQVFAVSGSIIYSIEI